MLCYLQDTYCNRECRQKKYKSEPRFHLRERWVVCFELKQNKTITSNLSK